MKICPCLECRHPVTPTQIMCSEHWKQLDDSYKQKIRQHKNQRSTAAYQEAVKDAVAEINHHIRLQMEMDDYIRFMS